MTKKIVVRKGQGGEILSTTTLRKTRESPPEYRVELTRMFSPKMKFGDVYSASLIDNHYVLVTFESCDDVQSENYKVLGISDTEEEADSRLVHLAREDFTKKMEDFRKSKTPKNPDFIRNCRHVFIDETR